MSDILPQKRCSTCKNFFPATTEFFHRKKSQKDGLNGQCKKCVSKCSKAYYSRPEVQEHVQAYKQTYYSRPDIKERERARHREYNQRPETIEQNRIRNRARYRSPKRQAWLQDYSNRPETIERERAYMEVYRKEYYSQPENLAHKNSVDREYHARPEIKERDRDARRIASASRRTRKRAIPGSHTKQQIQDLLKRQKHKCYYCSVKFEQKKGKYIYHVDHTFPINRVAGSGIPANDISYLVLACPDCNQSKGDKFPWEWHQGGKLL